MVRVQTSTPDADDTAERAARQRKRAMTLIVISGVLAIALVAVLAVIFTRGFSGGGSSTAGGAAGGCLPADLRITADPSIAGALEDVIAEAAGEDADCPDVAVTTEDSAVTAANLGTGADADFDIWVPDSAMWTAHAATQAKTAGVELAELAVGDTVATTPVVFAATASTAAALGDADAGFSSLLAQTVAPVVPDPSTVASSSAALLGLQTAVSGDARTFTGLVLALSTGTAPSTTDALAAASAATTPTIAVTTEQAVLQQGDGALVPIYPADVAPAIGAALVTTADASEETLGAADTLSAAFAEHPGVLATHGLRDGEGAPTDAAEGTEAIAPGDSTNQAAVLRTWQVLTAPSRMLALADVSGSMAEPADGDMTRMDLFEQAAVRAINALSTDSSMAIWAFSSQRIGAQDWQEIVPFGSLGDPAHKQRTIDTANQLDQYVGGGTGLYDSVLAAVQYMRETYVPGQINIVLLNTDGYNEDDDGLDLDGLLAKLAEIQDPTKPVPVIAVGYGPDTDQDALEKIAAATEGAAYQALQPTDIGTVLVDAVSQRGCRPYCS